MFKKFMSLGLCMLLLLLTVCLPSPVSAVMSGNVEMAGDPTFDSDSVSNNAADQWRWLSYPGARFALNPNAAPADVWNAAGPMTSDLRMDAGGYLSNASVRLGDILNVKLAAAGSSGNAASSVSTTWFPYKITFNASYSSVGNAVVSGYDFFKDADSSVIRVLQVSGNANKDLILGGTVAGNGGARWDSTNQVLVVSDSGYYYALRFVGLSGQTLSSVEISPTPSVDGSAWSLRIPMGTAEGTFGAAFGFAAASEGEAAAVARARGCFSQGVTQTLAATKGVFDAQLRKAPKPEHFGINSGINNYGVTPEQHRKAYYAAWTFVLQDLMGVLPENASRFNYKQVLCGKPSLWDGGADYCKGSCAWESFLAQQWLSYMMPQEAWNAYEGMMSLVDSNGYIPGEVLPARKAQTAWIIYKNGGCTVSGLAAQYDNIKRNLLWLENNPRWIFGSHDYSDEKDMEFCVSFVFDADFAIKIANEIGQSSDVALWQGKQAAMTQNVRSWLLNDPNRLYQCYFVDKQTHYYQDRGGDNPLCVMNAIYLEGLSDSENNMLMDYFNSFIDTNAGMGGLQYKHPPAATTLYGMFRKGYTGDVRKLINCALRDMIRVGNFGEEITTTPSIYGVRPSIFSCSGLIELTLMNNNCMTYTGTPEMIGFGSDTGGTRVPVLEDFTCVSDWNSKTNASIQTTNGIATITCGNYSYGSVAKKVTVDVTQNPSVAIAVSEVGPGAQWALKVNDGSGDMMLQGQTSQTGNFVYDLRGITGWSGTKTFDIVLFSVNGQGKYFKADYISAAPLVEDFSSVNDWNDQYNASVSASNGIGTIVCGNASYGRVGKSVTYNVSQYPSLTVSVPSVKPGTQWAFKVNDGSGDILLQGDTAQTGTFTYDLATITGWSGSKTFSIILYAVGGNGTYFNVDYISLEPLAEDFNNSSDWTYNYNASISAAGGIGTVTCGNASYGRVGKAVTYNLAQNPSITVAVPSVGAGAQWALNVSIGTGAETTLQSQTSQTGVFTYNLPANTGWNGMTTFNVILYAVGGNGKRFTVDYVAIDNRSGTLFTTGFEPGDAPMAWLDTADFSSNVTGLYSGILPECSPRSNERAYESSRALMYSGSDNSASTSYIYFKAFDAGIPVTAATKLCYRILPNQDNGRYAAVDLHCTDGTTLRDCGALDYNGFSMHPNAGHGGMLPVDSWTQIRCNIGQWLNGKTIDKIWIAYDRPAGTGQFRGYMDDIVITNGVLP